MSGIKNELEIKNLLRSLYQDNWINLGQYLEKNDFSTVSAFEEWFRVVVKRRF